MRNKKLVMALGLVTLLLVAGGVVGCGLIGGSQPSDSPEPSSPSESHRPANPLEEMEKPSEGVQGWKGKLSDIPNYPEGVPVADGIVRKVTSNTLDLESLAGAGAIIRNGEYEPGTETKMLQVVFNPDTEVYKWLSRVAKPELKELTLDDLSEGQQISVWGEETGDRVFADTIIITTGF